MPHRQQNIREFCMVCDEQAHKHCLRCGGPFCKRHRPKRATRCERCENTYKGKVTRKGLTVSKHRGILTFEAYKPIPITLASGILSAVLLRFFYDSILMFPIMLVLQISVLATIAFAILFLGQIAYRIVTGIDAALDQKRLKLFRQNFLKERLSNNHKPEAIDKK